MRIHNGRNDEKLGYSFFFYKSSGTGFSNIPAEPDVETNPAVAKEEHGSCLAPCFLAGISSNGNFAT